ncbi:P-loop containing nucleoside triphosphate hydrolase protein [Kalaharituber pfeilii]|nr:P-loop containing nucleoside triphosphate hydrolase protein [Kalaharituber pfeilii]
MPPKQTKGKGRGGGQAQQQQQQHQLHGGATIISGSAANKANYEASNTVQLPLSPPASSMPPRPAFMTTSVTKTAPAQKPSPPKKMAPLKPSTVDSGQPLKIASVTATMHGRPALNVEESPSRPRPQKSQSESSVSRNNDVDEVEEMNAHLSERFSKRGPVRGHQEAEPEVDDHLYPPHPLVALYEREVPEPISPWRLKPEIPTVKDLLTTEVDIPPNRLKGKWADVEEYLGSHYELLREDAYSSLRNATLSVKMTPDMEDNPEICIYENVRFTGYTWSNFGVGVKCTFSLNRAKKKVNWAHSKRLIPGTLVSLSWDNFENETNIRLATVLARPLTALVDMDTPEIDLLFSEDQIEIDTTKSWLMVESRGSYFEAYKHTLKALQRMKPSNFPLHEHIVSLNPDIPPPQYLADDPILDLSHIFPDADSSTGVQSCNVLERWPRIKETTMDKNQLKALQRMITKRLAIVQGPPGTGKTYTSVLALKALIKNMKEGDPPIVVSCQTNHALDQLLRKIVEFESDVIRLGGRTQDVDLIKKRTLYEIRLASPIRVKSAARGRAKAEMSRLQKRMITLLEPLKTDLLSPQMLNKAGIITDQQLNAFTKRCQDWVSAKDDSKPAGDMADWLEGYIDEVVVQQDIYNELEEEELETEQLLELEAEFHGSNDEVEFALKGTVLPFGKRFVVAEPPGVDPSVVREYMKSSKVWEWEGYIRAAVYKVWEKLAIKQVLVQFREANVKYGKLVKEHRIARLERDAYILGKAKVVGMTNTGLAKYRSLVASLCPKIVMIEEAAESLEGPIITGCFPTVQHLILVGDHQQLRPHCNDRELARDPYNLGVSMFERLVDNGIGYDRLKVQWRMRPEIRRLLTPIYKDLEDHGSVMNKDHIPGMNNVDVFFYWHTYQEAQDEGTSRLNHHEAEMMVNFTKYLKFNGVDPKHITILVFYGGQRSYVIKLLRKDDELRPHANDIKVATVDSYQGEENEVILLSLVRSNSSNIIGFLNVKNRVCVALSRAKKGLYIFGNGRMITHVNELWWEVSKILNVSEPKKIGFNLPVTCQRHGKRVEIKEVSHWLDNKGGCFELCGQLKPCKHICKLKCHPFGHETIKCMERCEKKLECCGAACMRSCHEPCRCRRCDQQSFIDEPIPPSEAQAVSAAKEIRTGAVEATGKNSQRTVRNATTSTPAAKSSSLLGRKEITTSGSKQINEDLQDLIFLPKESPLIDLGASAEAPPPPPPIAPAPSIGWEWDKT